MKAEYQSQKYVEQAIVDVVRKYLDLRQYRVFFFGSRVKGDNFERADIDVGIEGPRPLPPEIKLAIKEELENLPTLYKIDLVDFATVSDQFKKEALKYIEPVKI